MITPAVLISGTQLSNAVGILYICPASTTVVVTHGILTNTDSGSQTATLYVVRQGSAPDTTTIVLDAKSISAGASYISGELLGVVLTPGDTIQGLAAAASKVAIYVSGYTQV